MKYNENANINIGTVCPERYDALQRGELCSNPGWSVDIFPVTTVSGIAIGETRHHAQVPGANSAVT